MDSSFNYEKSPIIFYPKRRMSLKDRDKTIPWAVKKIDKLLNSHAGENGIIHSGSYEIASKIFEQLSDENRKRVLVYQGTQEKEKALEKFFSEKNLVLMGPSILEGLDLFSEKSRFQVFLKIPFPSLGDRFVNAKMKYQPDWYDWVTITQVLQGVGRSVRSEDDWAITYVLDGCLVDLLKRRRSSFPPEFQRRIRVVSDDI
jgi:Rad3-related DNA helicase